MNFTLEQVQQIIQEELEDIIAEDCWDGYERVEGTAEGAPGSCRKKTDESINEEQIDEAEICKKGKDWVDGKTIGGQKVSRGKDGKFNNWSARAAQIASKYCKDPNYGKGRGKDSKKEGIIREEEGGLKKWERENWTHSDGSPCGAPKGGGDGSDSRCKPASKWAKMSSKEKKADNAKKKRGTDKGKQYVKSNYPVKNESRKRVIEVRIVKKSKLKEQKNCGCGQDPCKTYGLQEQYIREEEMSDKDRKELEQIRDKLYGASKAHKGQADKLDGILKEEELEEAVYQGRTVTLNKPMRGDVKKFKVYVNSGKKDKDGKVIAKKVNFGHGGTSAKAKGEKTMKIRKNNPKARKNFRARHGCDNPGPKTKAKYWSCKKW